MSEQQRQRRLHVENRLAELEWKYGPLERSMLPEPDIEPSWGPVGSLLKRTDPELYEHVMRQHLDALAVERTALGIGQPPTIDAQAPGSPATPSAPPKPPYRPPERSHARPSDW